MPSNKSIFNAIKNNKIEISSRPRQPLELTNMLAFFTTGSLKTKVFNNLKPSLN